jgi:hypothetical protein
MTTCRGEAADSGEPLAGTVGRARVRRTAYQPRHACGVAAAILAAAAALFGNPPRALAQETRADAIRQEQAEKQRALAPPRLNRAELVIERLQRWGLTGEPRGVYPFVDSVFPGGGFAVGAGVRRPVGDDGAVDVLGAYSVSRFWHVQATAALPTFAQNRAQIVLRGRYLDAPDVKYFGVGNDTAKEDRTRFGYTPWGGGGRLDYGVSRYISIGSGIEYLGVGTSSGRSTPSIEELFSPADTPGLGVENFAYINTMAHASVDWRRRPGYGGSGGLYRVQVDDYHEPDRAAYAFRSVEAEVVQLIPLLRANWVVGLRGLATVTDVDAISTVPYFMLPSLGGGRTLRGYPDFRFRDRHRLLINAEVRWTPARFLDMAVFYDTGKVAAERKDLDFNDLHDSYGIGMRLVGDQRYVFRVEVAHSREHAARLVFSAGAAF